MMTGGKKQFVIEVNVDEKQRVRTTLRIDYDLYIKLQELALKKYGKYGHLSDTLNDILRDYFEKNCVEGIN